jgi:hypothetical protein
VAVATKAKYTSFVGSKRQVTNQWVQWFILAFALIYVSLAAWHALNIPDEGWWLWLRATVKAIMFAVAFQLVRGPLGQVLNGPRIEAPPMPHESMDAESLQLYYYPSGGSLPTEQAPKRQPIRQPEED